MYADLAMWWPLVSPPAAYEDEVAYLLPIAAAMTFVAETGNPLAARAAEIILLGALAIGWISGAVVRAAPGGRVLGRALHLAVVIAATAAVIYLTVIREGLIDLLVETWRHGHEGR